MVITAPRISLVPEYDYTLGPEARELAARAGLIADDHQTLIIDAALGMRNDGKFAAFEVGVVEPRQNGKGGALEIRELAGVELLGEKLIIHSAHEYATALEAFYRMGPLLEEAEIPIQRVRNAHGEQGFDFKNGCRIRYRTRTRGGGKGFSCDALLLDESFELPEFAHAALLPTMSARARPQVWYTSSSVDQEVHDHGIVLARVRERAQRQEKSLVYFEWSLPYDHPDDVPDEVASSELAWAEANPAMNLRISPEHVEHEYRSLSSRNFAVERLGVGDWPATDGTSHLAISPKAWADLTDKSSKLVDPIHLVYDIAPDRSKASIVATGYNQAGLLHAEVVEHKMGTAWLLERLPELNAKHHPDKILCDGVGPAASLVKELEPLGVYVETITAQEYAQSCAFLVDTVASAGMRHLGTPELMAAIRGATKRPLQDAFAFSRRNSTADITSLVATAIGVRSVATYGGGGLYY